MDKSSGIINGYYIANWVGPVKNKKPIEFSSE